MANPEVAPGGSPGRGSQGAAQVAEKPRVFFGWWVVASLAALRFIGSGVGMGGRSLYVLPLESSLGVSRASISSIFTASQLTIGLTGTLAGWLVDHYGPRKVMFVSLLISATGFYALAVANSMWALILIFGVPLGLTYNWAVTQPATAITNNWFDRRKATALSLLNVGTGGGGLVIPVLALAITQLGWRWASALSGIAFLVVALPVVALVRNTPEEMGLAPDGDQPETAKPHAAKGSPPALTGETLLQALRTPLFWSMAIGALCLIYAHSTLTAHLVPIIVWKGSTEALGAQLLSLHLILGIPIVLVAARATDRFDGPRVLVVMTVLSGLGSLVLINAQQEWGYWLAVSLLAPAGTPMWAILWAVLGRAYGRRHFNMIRGTIYGLLLTGASPGPMIAGLIFDRSGSYTPWLWVTAALAVVGIVSFTAAIRSQTPPSSPPPSGSTDRRSPPSTTVTSASSGLAS